MVFVGKTVFLAPLGKEDLYAVWQFRSYAPIAGFMDDYHHFDKEAKRVGVDPYILFRSWALNQMFGTNNFHYGVYTKSPVELIGAVWSTEVTEDTIWPTILIDRKHWGKGYAEDATETLLKAFLGPMHIDGKPEGGFHVVNIFIHDGNKPSLSFARRLGFKETGYLERANSKMKQRIFAFTKEMWNEGKGRVNENKRPKRKAKVKEVAA